MHILFTRPLEDSHELILKFQRLGHEVSHMPLINIEGKKYEPLNFLILSQLIKKLFVFV